MDSKPNGYTLSRQFFDWCYENPEKICPGHIALFFYCVELCNRLGWKEKFSIPRYVAMESVGIKSHKTYSKAFKDLEDWGFIHVISESKNQHTANVIALVKNTEAHTKALDRAIQGHDRKLNDSSVAIIKPETNNKEPETIYRQFEHLKISKNEYEELEITGYSKAEIDDVLDNIENFKKNTSYKSLFLTAKNWLKNKNHGNTTKTNGTVADNKAKEFGKFRRTNAK